MEECRKPPKGPKRAIHAFKGIRATARAIGCNPGNVSKWARREFVPSHLQPILLERAEELNLELTAEDLIPRKDAS